MKVEKIAHGEGHTVQVTTLKGDKRTLPLTLTHTYAVQLASQLEHLHTGAGTLARAAAILQEAIKKGEAHIHHYVHFDDHCSVLSKQECSAHVLGLLLRSFINPDAPFIPPLLATN